MVKTQKTCEIAFLCTLVVVILISFSPVRHADFISYDDPDYVVKNEVVQRGLSLEGVKWAFTTGHSSNWHPLTWLAHMLDWKIFGNNPGAHHFSNALTER